VKESDYRAEIRRLKARIAEIERTDTSALPNRVSTLDDLAEFYRTAPVGLCLVDTELRYVHVNEFLASMNAKPIAEHIGRTLYEVIPEVAELIGPIFRRVLETGETVIGAEVEANAPGAVYHQHTYRVTYQPFCLRDGTVAGVSTVVEDVTDLKRTEHRLRTTIRELDHRVKNTLSTLQSLAASTAQSYSRLDEFLPAYRGRIEALARMHAPLTEAKATLIPVKLSRLVDLVVSPLCATSSSVSTVGEDLSVSGRSVRPLGLTLHELATNAVKFGALSRSTGHVRIGSFVGDEDGSSRAHISWTESGGPDVGPPSQRGFGTTLIEETLPYELGASVEFDLLRSGVRCQIVLPLRDGAV
jgi:two-component sensor histidine kinase